MTQIIDKGTTRWRYTLMSAKPLVYTMDWSFREDQINLYEGRLHCQQGLYIHKRKTPLPGNPWHLELGGI